MIKRLSFFICVLFIGYCAKGQEDTTLIIKRDSVYENVDVPASFKGSDVAWYRFLQFKLVYPSEAVTDGIEGSVTVGFDVEIDGRIKNVHALDGPKELRDGAILVVKKSPNWIPAKKYGKSVKSYNTTLVNYTLHLL